MDDDASPAAACTTAAGGERVLAAIAGVLLLAGFFLPARDLVTHSLAIEWRPSAELAGLLFLVALFALACPQFAAESGGTRPNPDRPTPWRKANCQIEAKITRSMTIFCNCTDRLALLVIELARPLAAG